MRDEVTRVGNTTAKTSSLLEVARSATRRSHASAVKDSIGNWHSFSPGLSKKKDEPRGWGHDECARLLCPPSIEWNEMWVISSSLHPPSYPSVGTNRTYRIPLDVRNSNSVQTISRGSSGREKQWTIKTQPPGFCVTRSCLP